jgi:L-amino acid N-acyltransferase YncA
MANPPHGGVLKVRICRGDNQHVTYASVEPHRERRTYISAA